MIGYKSKCPVKLLLWLIVQTFMMVVSAAAETCTSLLSVPNAVKDLRMANQTTIEIVLCGPGLAQSDARYTAHVTINNPNVVTFDYEETKEAKEVKIDFAKSCSNETNAFLQNMTLPSANSTERDAKQKCAAIRVDASTNGKNPTCRCISVPIKGKFLGITTLDIEVKKNGAQLSHGKLELAVPITVLRSKAKEYMSHIFVGTLSILMIVANILMGCKLQIEIVWKQIRRPVAPAIGLFCQFLVMPLLAYGIGRGLFAANNEYALGLGAFTSGCSPGGGASNIWTVLWEGNVDLSVTMTFVSTAAALLTVPAWMFGLGRYFLQGNGAGEVGVPYRNIVVSLCVLILPIGVGILIRRFRAKWADVLVKILRPFSIVIILFICTFGVYANWYMMKLLTWRVIVTGLVLPWGGFLMGAVCAFITRRTREDTIAIMIETGVQNSGIAILLLQYSFDKPFGWLASVVPVAVSIFTPVPLLIGAGVIAISNCYSKKTADDDKSGNGVVLVEHGDPMDDIAATMEDDVNDYNPQMANSTAKLILKNGGMVLDDDDAVYKKCETSMA